MKLALRRFLFLAAAAATLLAIPDRMTISARDAWSQTRTIKIIVPFTPGSPPDIPARLLAEQISRAQGTTMLVENRPGASGTIGTEAVARAVADGNTLLITTPALVIDPHLRKLNYDPLTSFEPICDLTSSPTVIAVNNASPYRTLAGLLDAARAKSGVVTMAGVGPATTAHIAFEMLKRAANVDMTFVPYPGGNAAVNALLGGHVTSVFVPYPGVAAQLQAGQLRALATATRMRIEALPDVPTVAESGYSGYEMEAWFGVVAPAKTPSETLSQLSGWFSAALQASGVRSKLVVQGLRPVGTCGADFGALIRKQYDDFGRIIREAKIKAE
jgi:tripartite-type tricarboxylate transporter receptor subunit TctC